MDLDGIDLRTTFFSQAVRAASDAGRTQVTMPLDTWLAEGTEERDPIAFVFHVGRCGSSVVVNMLNARPDVLVVSELQLMNALVRDALADGNDEPLRVGIRRLVAVSPGPVVVKTTSWTIAAAPTIAKLFPKAQLLFLTRDIEEVVASCQREPPAWAGMRADPPLELFPTLEGRPATEIELFQAAWQAAMDFAATLPDDRTLRLSYEVLAEDAPAAAAVIVSHLGLTPDEVLTRQMLATTRVHAKDPSLPWPRPQPA